MAVPCRYWRIYFRSRTNYTTAQLAFASLMPKDVSGANLTTDLTITTNATLINGTTYPLTALVDGSASTYCGINYPSSNANTWYYFTYTYASAVLIDRLLCNIYDATSLKGSTIVVASLVDIVIDSSEDNVTWVRQGILYGPITSGGTDILIGALTSSGLYPIPSALEIGGGGGIYGIVSEDGVAQPNRPVYLLERETQYKVGYTTTNEYGGYSFNGLNLAREFTVFSIDPSGPPYKNALIWDRIRPINTKGNVTPQSSFWARRARDPALGGVVAYSGLMDGVYKQLRTNVLGNSETIYYNNATALAGFDFYPDSAVGGAILFLKSPRHRTVNPLNLGLHLPVCSGCFNGVNASGNSSSYAQLTFEFIIKTPQAGETGLVIIWWGTRDSDDYNHSDLDSYFGPPSGPAIEVTNTTLNVRIPLGTVNFSTVRCTTPVVAGQIYHVMVTYEVDEAIRLYMDGVLVQTTTIAGSGRIFTWSRGKRYSNHFIVATEDWNYTYDSGVYGAMRRVTGCSILGYGTNSNVGPAGWGGGLGMTAFYGRKFSDADVATFYDSFVNWETHVAPVYMSGYCGEVEADNPKYYFRLNELAQTRGIVSYVGHKDMWSSYEGAPVLNATGFVAGAGALTTSNGGVYLRLNNSPVIESIFTVEFFIRPSSVAGTQRLLLQRVYNSSSYVYVSLVAGVISLTIIDHSGTTNVVTCPGTFVAGTVYHIGLTYDPFVEKLCRWVVNGVLVGSFPAVGIIDTVIRHTAWFGIGFNPTSTGPSVSERFQGQIGELAIYNYPVPTERLQVHYAARNN